MDLFKLKTMIDSCDFSRSESSCIRISGDECIWLDIFNIVKKKKNNTRWYRGSQANSQYLFIYLFFVRVSRREHGDPQIEELNIGEASEPEGRGTGECSSRIVPQGGARAPLDSHSGLQQQQKTFHIISSDCLNMKSPCKCARKINNM